MDGAEIQGVAVTDAQGSVVFASGTGCDPRIRSLARDPGWMKESIERRLVTLTLDRQSYAVLVTPIADGHLLVFSRAGSAVLDFFGSVDFAYDIIEHLVTDPFDAMTIVDPDGRLVYISPVHESFFGLKRGEGNGQPV